MTATDPTPPTDAPDRDAEAERALAELFHGAEARAFFGPSFFLGQLGGFIRDRCPRPEDQLPVVQLHVMGGEVLDVCHVIGLGPSWVALAVRDETAPGGMRTEMVPYPCIIRVTIRAAEPSRRVGFDGTHIPAIVRGAGATASPAELMVRAAFGATGPGGH